MHFTCILQTLYKHSHAFHKHFTSILHSFHKHFTCISHAFCMHCTSILQAFYKHLQACYMHLTCILHAFYRHFTRILQAFYMHFTYMLHAFYNQCAGETYTSRPKFHDWVAYQLCPPSLPSPYIINKCSMQTCGLALPWLK